MPQQLTFDWPNGVALGADDFYISQPNAQAYAMLNAPDTWPERKLVIVGPTGCGKSHLARIAERQMGGVIHDSCNLPDLPAPNAVLIIEAMHNLPASAQEHMFHLHNHLRSTNGTLLMTATTAPSRWPLTLPDLASRMQATTVVKITEPDDALLQALLMKLFADRQINPGPKLIPYLAKRIERSFDAADSIVSRLDKVALEQSAPISVKLAAQLLDNDG